MRKECCKNCAHAEPDYPTYDLMGVVYWCSCCCMNVFEDEQCEYYLEMPEYI